MRPARPPLRSAAVLALVLLAAPLLGWDCGGKHHGDASVPDAALRPDAIALWDAAEQPSRNNTASRDIGVLDVARFGTTVAVLAVLAAQAVGGTTSNPVCPATCPPIPSPGALTLGYQLFVSHDDGATWDPPIPIQWPVGVLSPRPTPAGVMLAAAVPTGIRAWIVGEYYPDTARASAWRRTVREFSLTSKGFIANPTVDDVIWTDKLVQRGAKAWDYEAGSVSYGGGIATTVDWSILDLSSGVLQHGGASLPSSSTRYPWSWGTQNGSSWVAAQAEGGQVCIYRVTPATSATPTRTCSAAASYPAELMQSGLEALPVPASRGLVLLAQQPRAGDGHVVGAALDTAAGFDLGPGEPPPQGRVHPPFALAVRTSQASSSVYDLTSTGIDTVTYPASPCSGATCGQGAVLAWAQPLASGKHLALYVVDLGKFDAYGRVTSHPVLAALTVTPSRAPLGGGSGGNPGLAAVAAPAFMNGCTAMSSCFGTKRQRCVDTFLAAQFYGPRLDLMLKYNQGCAVLGGIWPDAALVGKPGCVQGCQGNVAVTCASGAVATATDCTRYASTCGTAAGVLVCGDGSPSLACNTCSAKGSAVTCTEPVPTASGCAGIGSVCIPDPAGGPFCQAGGTCTAGQVGCSSDLLTQCQAGYFRATRCGDLGLTCTADGAGACVAKATYAACAAGTFAETCDGTRALYCSGGALLATDCAAIGFGRCVVTDGEARCAP